MSLVVFPFKTENPEVVTANLRIAAEHPAVSCVLAVGYEEESTYRSIADMRRSLIEEIGTPVELMLQERIGTLRPGKGDGMNTALRYFLNETDASRVHFYDADITSFGSGWITKAEQAADQGFGVVRHFFPRSSTDAMITWMITRTGFAVLWPESELPLIEQPLGGELLFTRPVVEALAADIRVQAQSDWGIDTLYTYATIRRGFSVYETYIEQGKAHALYGGLTDLRTMLIECFTAIQSLRGEPAPGPVNHRVEPTAPVPASISEKIGYDLEATLRLLGQGWTDRQSDLLSAFSPRVRDGMERNRREPSFSFMSEDAWYETYGVLLDRFRRGDADWEQLLFRLWVTRVVSYTATQALRGYDPAQRYLQAMVHGYIERSATST